MEPAAFKNLLRFLYTDEVNSAGQGHQLGPDTVMATLYAAKKYAVGQLERECVEYLRTHLRPDNACMLLEQALLFDEETLADQCLRLIDKSSCEALASDCFLDLRLDTLIRVIGRDTLGIRELKLFRCLVRWAEHQCKLQDNPINR